MVLLINPPSRTPRPRGTAVTSYLPLDTSLYDKYPNRWAFEGVQFVPYGCTLEVEETTQDPCDDDFEEANGPQDFEDEVVFLPFSFRAAMTCSALGMTSDEIEKHLNVLWEAEVSTIIAEQVMHGEWNAASHTLVGEADTLTVAGMDNPLEVVALVEDGLADRWGNSTGMIHVTPSILTQVVNELEYADGKFYTPNGHIVVSDAGYQGGAPGTGTVTAGETWVYGSSPVHFKYQTPDWSGYDFENWVRDHNDLLVRKDGIAIAVFEPCTVVAAKVDYTP
jgi:hypothetical protein